MASPFGPLASWRFLLGYVSNVARGQGGDFMAPGSENGMVAQGGITAHSGPKLVANKLGSRIFFNCHHSFAGLGTLAENGLGSVFGVRRLLAFIGQGQVNFKGDAIVGVNASQILSYLAQAAGVFVAGPDTGPFQAGHAQPSAPSIFAKASPSAGKSPMSGAVVVGVWRVSDITGQESLCSLPSNVLVLNNETVIVQIPLADANGQTHFGIGVVKIGYETLGVIYELPISLGGEVAEADLAYTRGTGAATITTQAITGATNATPIVVASAAHGRATGQQVEITGVTGNTAANGTWTITVVDAGHYSLDGSVGNGAYGAGGLSATNVVDAAGANLTGADVGRRWAFGAYDSWIVSVSSATRAVMNDFNTSGATITDDGTITHAVDGHTRAVEISWSNGALIGSALAPGKAFPPVPGNFAGVKNDTVWLDADGIIYISEPGQIGSFAPKNARFAPEPAVTYVETNDGVLVRFGKVTIGAFYYVGGSPAMEYQTIVRDRGILLAQNAALGFDGNLLAWIGKPTVIQSGTIEPSYDYAVDVLPEFKGWENQTADQPVVVEYDPRGQNDVWCYGTTIMSKHGPTRRWNSPLKLAGKIPGNIMAAVKVNIEGVGHVLYLACKDVAHNKLALYQFDGGNGTVLKVQTSDISRGSFGGDVTLITGECRVDNLNNPIVVQIVRDYHDNNPTDDPLDGQPAQTPAAVGTQPFYPREPNVIDCGAHAVLVTMTSDGGDCGLNSVNTFGSSSNILRR